MAIGKSIVDVLKSITGKNVETIVDGLEEALSGGGSGGGGILIVNNTIDAQTEVGTLDKTWQEINDADFAVIYSEITVVETDEITLLKSPAFSVGYDQNDGYFVSVLVDGTTINTFYTDSSSGYPVYTKK